MFLKNAVLSLARPSQNCSQPDLHKLHRSFAPFLRKIVELSRATKPARFENAPWHDDIEWYNGSEMVDSQLIVFDFETTIRLAVYSRYPSPHYI